MNNIVLAILKWGLAILKQTRDQNPMMVFQSRVQHLQFSLQIMAISDDGVPKLGGTTLNFFPNYGNFQWTSLVLYIQGASLSFHPFWNWPGGEEAFGENFDVLLQIPLW